MASPKTTYDYQTEALDCLGAVGSDDAVNERCIALAAVYAQLATAAAFDAFTFAFNEFPLEVHVL